MKKVISLILSLVMVSALFSGCASSKDSGSAYKVAIVQQLDHSSLDEIRAAVVAQLNARAQEAGVTLSIDEANGQNDATVLNQIGAKVVSDQVDLIIPIATLAATTMVTNVQDFAVRLTTKLGI